MGHLGRVYTKSSVIYVYYHSDVSHMKCLPMYMYSCSCFFSKQVKTDSGFALNCTCRIMLYILCMYRCKWTKTAKFLAQAAFMTYQFSRQPNRCHPVNHL